MNPLEYDRWYDENRNLYWPEILALKRVIKRNRFGLEIGVGSGRFALPLGVDVGIDPSFEMLQIARAKGIEVVEGKGENIPFKCCIFDYVLMVTTLCFLDDVEKTLREARRVLKKGGKIVIGMIPKNSNLGNYYLQNRENSTYFRDAKFFDTKEIVDMLESLDFNGVGFLQTLIGYPREKEYKRYSKIEKGNKKGSFVVIYAYKKPEVK